MIVAITGRSGSGKSYIAAHYASLGYTVIDADVVARQVLEGDIALQQELANEFGKDIIDENGVLLRKELSNRAFVDEKHAKKLADITHPHIVKQILQLAQESKANPVFVDGAVIIGALFEQYCDKIIVVTAPHADAITRIMQRDGISRQAAENRLAAQMYEAELRERADYILENNSGKEKLLVRAETVLQSLQQDINEKNKK